MTVESPFRGLLPTNSNFQDGKQAKKRGTGIYHDRISNRKYYVKASEKYPADDMADVTGSIFLNALIGEKQTIRYKLIKNKHEGINYVYSEIRPHSVKLSEKDIAYRSFLKGWVGCSPTTDASRERIYQTCFANKPQLIRDMAKILVGCLVNLDLDCQVDNIVEYTDETGNRRLAKFDGGWMLAGILKDKHKIIKLFDKKDRMGKKATHIEGLIGSPLPANHYGFDYPKIIQSKEFVEEIEAASQNLRKLVDSVIPALNEIAEKNKLGDPEETERLQLKAFKTYAQHLGYKDIENKSAEKLKQDIAKKLKKRFIERTQSLQLVKCLMQINSLNVVLSLEVHKKNSKTLNGNDSKMNGAKKRNKKHNKKEYTAREVRKISTSIFNLIKVIKKHFAGQAVKDFMPNFEPNVETLLNGLLKSAKICNTQSKISSGIIDIKWLDFIENLKNGNFVIPGAKPSEEEILKIFDGKNAVSLPNAPKDDPANAKLMNKLLRDRTLITHGLHNKYHLNKTAENPLAPASMLSFSKQSKTLRKSLDLSSLESNDFSNRPRLAFIRK